MNHPTPAELEILHILWEAGEASTPEVHEKLSLTNDGGYTRTLKFMQLMHEKGLVGRRREGKSHVYFALAKEEETKGSLLDRFINATFGGSKSKLVMQLLGNKKVSKKEIAEIRAYLDDLERKKK